MTGQSHNPLPPSFLGMDAWMTSQLKCSFDSHAKWIIDVLGLFLLHVIRGSLYNQTLADVRSTGAGI